MITITAIGWIASIIGVATVGGGIGYGISTGIRTLTEGE